MVDLLLLLISLGWWFLLFTFFHYTSITLFCVCLYATHKFCLRKISTSSDFTKQHHVSVNITNSWGQDFSGKPARETPVSRKDIRHRAGGKNIHCTWPPLGPCCLCARVCVCWTKGCEGIPFNSTGRNFSTAYFPQFPTFNYTANGHRRLPPKSGPPPYLCGRPQVRNEHSSPVFIWANRGGPPKSETKNHFLKAAAGAGWLAGNGSDVSRRGAKYLDRGGSASWK